MKKSKSKLGGARPGAGRKKTGRNGTTISLYVDSANIDRARLIGDGNFSAGIRKALEYYPLPLP